MVANSGGKFIINGGMSVAQRYGTTATTPTMKLMFLIDGEYLSQTGKFSVQQVEDVGNGEGTVNIVQK